MPIKKAEGTFRLSNNNIKRLIMNCQIAKRRKKKKIEEKEKNRRKRKNRRKKSEVEKRAKEKRKNKMDFSNLSLSTACRLQLFPALQGR
jgi:hypothetical protein